jgi:hypothetical protein
VVVDNIAEASTIYSALKRISATDELRSARGDLRCGTEIKTIRERGFATDVDVKLSSKYVDNLHA